MADFVVSMQNLFERAGVKVDPHRCAGHHRQEGEIREVCVGLASVFEDFPDLVPIPSCCLL